MCKKDRTPYVSPLCAVLEISHPEILCSSNVTVGGSMENVGDLEDIFGNN